MLHTGPNVPISSTQLLQRNFCALQVVVVQVWSSTACILMRMWQHLRSSLTMLQVPHQRYSLLPLVVQVSPTSLPQDCACCQLCCKCLLQACHQAVATS